MELDPIQTSLPQFLHGLCGIFRELNLLQPAARKKCRQLPAPFPYWPHPRFPTLLAAQSAGLGKMKTRTFGQRTAAFGAAVQRRQGSTELHRPEREIG